MSFPSGWRHLCIPNLFSGAIELVCGGSPIACILIECKAQHSKTQIYSHWWNKWKLFAAHSFHWTGTFHSTMRSSRLGEPPPMSLLSWSRGGLLNGWRPWLWTRWILNVNKRKLWDLKTWTSATVCNHVGLLLRFLQRYFLLNWKGDIKRKVLPWTHWTKSCVFTAFSGD